MSDTIKREASDATKGFRLQKMRAVKLMLETLDSRQTGIFYTAVEDSEDVSHATITDESAEKYYEEDKNYSQTHSFTINSPEVKNTLVSFFDFQL